MWHLSDPSQAALWDWRDRCARAEDESVDFIMSNAELLRIAQRLPRTSSHLLECQPLSQLVRERAEEVVAIIDNECHEGPVPLASQRPSTSSFSSSFSPGAKGLSEEGARERRGVVTPNVGTSSQHGKMSIDGAASSSSSSVCTFTPAVIDSTMASMSTDPHHPSPVLAPEEVRAFAFDVC